VKARWSPSETLAGLVGERERAVHDFFEANGDRLARACHEMARAFAGGGVLIPYGTGAAATDAAHVAVEFMHPVIVGKRALPAISVTGDPTGLTSPAALSRAGDIALALAHEAPGAEIGRFVDEARRRGLVTIAMTGGDPPPCDFGFDVRDTSPAIVQEVQETAYHMLWELVHVFFEHPGLLDDACITCGDVAVEAEVVSVSGASAVIEKDGLREEIATELVGGVAVGDRLLCHAGVALERLAPDAPVEARDDDPAGFLYPFLGREEHDVGQVLDDVRSSISQKAADVIEQRRAIDLDAVEACGRDLRGRLDAGARLIAFGNGGSSTDAQDMAADFVAAGWPALALNNDVATITAVGNDVGYENVFARQLIALARPRDIAVAISTSGSSPNVIAAVEEARRREMFTLAIAGYDGGRLAEVDGLDRLFRAHGDYVPRLQEVHATIYHLLLEAVGRR
jgi:D-sedoheptulose 7-phosphate isomerase